MSACIFMHLPNACILAFLYRLISSPFAGGLLFKSEEKMRTPFLASIVLVLGLCGLANSAWAQFSRVTPRYVPASQVSVETEDPEEERARNGFALYGGRSCACSVSEMLSGDTDFEDTWLVSVSYSRRIFTVLKHLDIEVEANVAKRFGNANAWEFNGGLMLRWTAFPWSDYVPTTLGVLVIGPSYATEISDTERENSDGDGSKFLNFFAIELTFAAPSNPDLELLLRLHHRSGMFGLYNGVRGASNFLTAGLRYRF